MSKMFASDDERPQGLNDFKSNIVSYHKNYPVILRLCKNPLTGEQRQLFEYFEYKVGAMTFTTPSLESLGVGEDPRKTKYKSLKKQMDDLKAAGKGKTKEYEEVEKLASIFKPKTMIWVWGFEPDSDILKAHKFSRTIASRLYGDEGNVNMPAVPSLMDEMKKKGMSLFMKGNPDNDKVGWIQVRKTGEKMGTRYFVDIHCVETERVVDGEKMYVMISVKKDIPESIYTRDWKIEDVPDIVAFESKNAWTKEEAERFVKEWGVYVPDRIKEKHSKKADNGEDLADLENLTGDANLADPSQLPNLDQIPF